MNQPPPNQPGNIAKNEADARRLYLLKILKRRKAATRCLDPDRAANFRKYLFNKYNQ